MSQHPRQMVAPPSRGSEHASHRYAVGDSVTLSPDPTNSALAKGSFRITRQLPPVGSALQYRIQAVAGSQEMVVTEHQLARVAGSGDLFEVAK